jgi:hypothetical protein
MVRMIGRLEPVCLDETVEDHQANLEEHLEREVIYTNHLEAQAVLVTVTTADDTDTVSTLCSRKRKQKE